MALEGEMVDAAPAAAERRMTMNFSATTENGKKVLTDGC